MMLITKVAAAALALVLLIEDIHYAQAFTPLSFLTPDRYQQRQYHHNHLPNPLFYQNDNATDSTTTSPFSLSEANTNGIITITDEESLYNFQRSHPDKLLVLKFHAPYCRACKRVAPLYKKLSKQDVFQSLPIVFGEINARENMKLVKQMGIGALPTVSIYAGSDGEIMSMLCGPSKIPLLKTQLEDIVKDRFDGDGNLILFEDRPFRESSLEMEEKIGTINSDDMSFLRNNVPYLKELTEMEFMDLMEKATLQTYAAGSVIIRQGMPGRSFYVIKDGEAEVIVKTGAEDPLSTSNGYLGQKVNTLASKDYFGERALMTGEDLAASVRATCKTTCFSFHSENFPERSFLGMGRRTKRASLEAADEKYGVDVCDLYWSEVETQIISANMLNQARGSPNHPKTMRGVDTDEELMEEDVLKAIREAGWNTDEGSIFPPPEEYR